MEHKQFFIEELKAGEEAMTIEGYGSVFNNADQGGDIVLRGAFAKSIKSRDICMLWQHRTDMPIGVWDEVEEREKGLFVKGRFVDTTLGLDAYKLAKAGAVKGLSIGYGVKRFEIDQTKGVRKLLELDLYEVSPVTFPMNEKATITRVKGAAGAFMSESDFEEYLRDAGGLSHKEAKIVVSEGYRAMLKHRDGGAEELSTLATLFQQFKV